MSPQTSTQTDTLVGVRIQRESGAARTGQGRRERTQAGHNGKGTGALSKPVPSATRPPLPTKPENHYARTLRQGIKVYGRQPETYVSRLWAKMRAARPVARAAGMVSLPRSGLARFVTPPNALR